MRMLKTLIIAVVCVTFSMSAACSDDSDKTNNATVNNSADKKDVGSEDASKDESDAKVPDEDDTGKNDPDTKGEDPDAKDPDNEDLTAGDFMNQLRASVAGVNCAVAFHCPENGKPGEMLDLGRSGDEASCVAYFNRMNEQATDLEAYVRPVGSVEDGRTTYDPAKAADCLAEVAASKTACAVFDEAAVTRCLESVFQPTVAADGACASDSECIDGHCSISDDGVCPGTCIATPAAVGEGKSCEEAPCAAGLECVMKSGAEETCEVVKYVEAGVACDNITAKCKIGLECGDAGVCKKPVFAAKDAKCDSSTVCKPGLACIGVIGNDYELDGTCQTVRKEDEACLFPLQCAHGLYCDSTDIDVPGKCFALGTAGDACNDNGGDMDWCDDGFDCEEQEGGGFRCVELNTTIDICKIPGE